MSDGNVTALLSTLHDHLAETATRPVRADASRWLGEATAVARDLVVGPAPDDSVIRARLDHVEHLLSNVQDTEDPVTDEHVAAANAALGDAMNALDERERE